MRSVKRKIGEQSRCSASKDATKSFLATDRPIACRQVIVMGLRAVKIDRRFAVVSGNIVDRFIAAEIKEPSSVDVYTVIQQR